MSYIETIRTACAIFPILALLITLPYFLWQYHKIGTIHIGKLVCSYSFVLYFLCVYFLVILPLPSRESVRNLTTPYAQLIPFSFVKDIIQNSGFVLQNPGTWGDALLSFDVLQVVFNFIMMVPFGMYLRYLFRLNVKWTMFFSFLATLFFELTQLSGLYGIYPRPYRLFDVDDLMINFAGSMFGYAVVSLFKFIPSMDEIDYNAYKKVRKVTFLRRANACLVDFFVIGIIESIVLLIFGKADWYENNILLNTNLIPIIYLIVMLKATNGYTVGKKFVGIKVVSDDGRKLKVWQILVRYLMLTILYVIVPMILALFIGIFSIIILTIFKNDSLNQMINIAGAKISFDILIIGVLFIACELIYFWLLARGVKNKNKTITKLLYEKITKTSEVITLKYNKKSDSDSEENVEDWKVVSNDNLNELDNKNEVSLENKEKEKEKVENKNIEQEKTNGECNAQDKLQKNK